MTLSENNLPEINNQSGSVISDEHSSFVVLELQFIGLDVDSRASVFSFEILTPKFLSHTLLLRKVGIIVSNMRVIRW